MEAITTTQFKKYCAIVQREAGIHLTEEKRALLTARVSKRTRKLGIDARNYLNFLESDGHEMIHFLDAISTNHTFFFRESKSFHYLDSSCRQIWCAAASSGEEPYSIAIHCLSQGFEPTILATDISTECLNKGTAAIYSSDKVKTLSKSLLRTYFQKGQNHYAGFFRVKAEVRRLIQFERFNLIADPVPNPAFDVIFCRNVMIYFDNPTKENVVQKICTALKPQGLFIIGGAESLNGLNHGLKYIEPSVYQKK